MSTEDDARSLLGKVTIGDLGDAEATFSVEIPAFVAANLRPEIVVEGGHTHASEAEMKAVEAHMAEALDIVLSADDDPEGGFADALEEVAKTLIEEDEEVEAALRELLDADGLMDDD